MNIQENNNINHQKITIMKIFIATAFARVGGWLARARRVRAALVLLLLLVTSATAWAQDDGGKPSQRGIYINNGRKIIIK